ncbi:MAG: 50S ribosomal protein L18 [Bacilli bacterium]|nr:50S ribosomal protein L18 [Bacilli bacterium]
MIKKIDRNKSRVARHTRVRNKVTGTSNVPRLNVFRSNNNIFAQIIDDEASKTLVSASSIDKELKLENGGNTEAAEKVGELLAKRAKKAKISKVVFDRGGYLYHGRVKVLAESARENGLEF